MLCHPQQVVTSKYARNASRVKENAAPSLRTQFVVFVRFIPTFKISTIGNLFIFHPIQYRVSTNASEHCLRFTSSPSKIPDDFMSSVRVNEFHRFFSTIS